MRPSIIALLTAGVLLASATASAQTRQPTDQTYTEPEKRLKLRTDFWYHLAATPAYAIWQNNLHEGTHAVVGATKGLTIKSYRPLPHTYDDENGESHFTFGRVVFEGKTSRSSIGWIAGSPMILEAGMFVSSDIMLGQINQDSAVAPFLWFGGLVWPLFQFTYSTLTPDETDLTMLTYSLDINYDIGVAAVAAISIAGLARTIVRGRQVLLVEENDPSPDDSLAVVPIFNDDFQGLSVQGRF